MRVLLFTSLLFFIFCSCVDEKKIEPKMTEAEAQKAMASLNELTFNPHSEEIEIISASHEINIDTISGIIKDYTSSTLITGIAKYGVVLDSLSIKYRRDKKEIAQIIFDYKSLQTHSNE